LAVSVEMAARGGMDVYRPYLGQAAAHKSVTK